MVWPIWRFKPDKQINRCYNIIPMIWNDLGLSIYEIFEQSILELIIRWWIICFKRSSNQLIISPQGCSNEESPQFAKYYVITRFKFNNWKHTHKHLHTNTHLQPPPLWTNKRFGFFNLNSIAFFFYNSTIFNLNESFFILFHLNSIICRQKSIKEKKRKIYV